MIQISLSYFPSLFSFDLYYLLERFFYHLLYFFLFFTPQLLYYNVYGSMTVRFLHYYYY